MEEKSPFGDCFSLFFNLIISQLFIGGISSLIELIRIFTINILSKYILKTEHIHKYGIYLQPMITAILLLIIGLSIYYFMTFVNSDGCNSGDLIKYLLYFFLVVIFIGFLLFVFFYFRRMKSTEQLLYNKTIGYRVN